MVESGPLEMQATSESSGLRVSPLETDDGNAKSFKDLLSDNEVETDFQYAMHKVGGTTDSETLKLSSADEKKRVSKQLQLRANHNHNHKELNTFGNQTKHVWF